MMDNGLGPKRVRIEFPRGVRYTIVTSEVIVTVRLHADGRMRAGRRPRDQSSVPQVKTAAMALPVAMFEFAVGEPGYVRWGRTHSGNRQGL
jgi:hypothetical protein